MDQFQAVLALDSRADLGEGAIWDPRGKVLRWVDINRQEVHAFDPVTRRDSHVCADQKVGTVVTRTRGGLVVALADGFYAMDLSSGACTLLARPEGEPEGSRFNDGKCDPAGRFWAGTMAKNGGGALYCLDRDHRLRRMLDGITTSNGITWSLDASKMYYIDTPTAEIQAFDYDLDSGNIDHKTIAARIKPGDGHPDGMTIDAEGKLWVALWGGYKVVRLDPANGEMLAEISVPTAHVTSCAFCGADLKDLYITTAMAGLSREMREAQPEAGCIFHARPGVAGVLPYEFAG